MSKRCTIQFVFFILATLFVSANLVAQEDPYENYIKTSKDFKAIKQDKEWMHKAWPTWVHMPWYYQWTIGWNDEAGKFSHDHGYFGAFTDHGNPKYLEWINKYKLTFYNDHTAGKGDLHIHPNKINNKICAEVKDREPFLNDATKNKLKAKIKANISSIMSSPYRAAYSLDDEISWGGFVKPCMWKITDDIHYRNWLKEIYGEKNVPENPGWISYESFRKKLKEWSIGDFDCHQFVDQLSFNDSYWANLLGELAEYANEIDPATPVGFVGGQSPNTFGGYDYAKIMKKIQFLEAYGLDDTQSLVRSLNPGNAMPVVSTHFHKSVNDTIWQTWYSLAHGNRGFIGWVEKWFDGPTPKSFHKEVGPHYIEVSKTISPLVSKATWVNDKVAIYYSHNSFQMSWILDAEAHGSTWINRNGDHSRGTSHQVGKAWRNMLRDEGLQFDYVSYEEVIRNGVPKQYKVLILPAVYSLSDIEAKKIKEFCQDGGTVIADFLCGIFDHHAKGRKAGGVLDDMFGVKQDPKWKQADIFTNGLWVEVDQDANWSNAGKYQAFLTTSNSCKKDESGFNIAVPALKVNNVNKFGKGTAVYMNLSPQWYNAYRQSGGMEECKKRSVFMKHIHDAGVKRWVEIQDATEKEFGYEISYWENNGRTYLFLCSNPESATTELGGGNSIGLKSDLVTVTLAFNKPLKGVKNERSGDTLGQGKSFKVSWKQNEAVVLSFEGHPYK